MDDGIINLALMKLLPVAMENLPFEVRTIPEHSYFPNLLMKAEVVMIPNLDKGQSFPQNYQSLILLSTLDEVAESVIGRRLRGDVELKPSRMNSMDSRRDCHLTCNSFDSLSKNSL